MPGRIELPTRWPLVTDLQNRTDDISKDARLVNCFVEFKPMTKEYWVQKRPGIGSAQYSLAGPNRGGIFWNSVYIAISGVTVYSNGNPIGTVSTSGTSQFIFQPIPSSPPLLAFNGDGLAYYTDGTTVTRITDVNFPVPCLPGWLYLNGTLYVMDPLNNIWGSDNEDDPTTWNALNFIVAQIDPGTPIFLTKQLTYGIAMKSTGTEVFYDSGQTVGGSGSSLLPAENYYSPFGCQRAESVQYIDGTLLWLSNNNSDASQIIRMDALQTTIVSTPQVERLLENSTTGSMYSFTLKIGGHRYYVITQAGNSNLTLVYDLDQQWWYIWQDIDGNFWPYSATAKNVDGLHLIQSTDNGNTYSIEEDFIIPTDRGLQVFNVDIFTPNFDAEVDREKYLPALYFNADRTPGSILQCRYSDDDFQHYSNFRSVNLNLSKPMLPDNGSFNRRTYHFRHACPTPFRIRSVGLSMDVGTL